MKKIVFVTIPIQSIEGDGWDSDGYVYRFSDNKVLEYDKKVHFAVNGFLAKTLKNEEKVKIVQILVKSEKSKRNALLQKDELEKLNESVGAHIVYETAITDFNESGKTIEKRFRELIGILESDCEIVLDMTYGSKTLIPILFYVMNFAEKFFNADIKNILYDKTEFQRLPSGRSVPNPEKCELYDVTSLFYLNSLTSVMEAPDGKTALARLDKFFAM